MPTEAAQMLKAIEALAQRLMSVFDRAGYEQIAPPIIQPAGPFLDVVGEALRGRTHVFTDPEGEELCLRPDLTVPTCRLHLARHRAGNVPARYSYCGLAFRYQPSGDSETHPAEFHQAGIESFAAADREREDAAVLALIIEALRQAGLEEIQLSIGDLALFGALLDAVPMPQRWRQRLWHHFWRRDAFRRVLVRLTSQEALKSPDLPRDFVQSLGLAAPEEAQKIVEEYLDRSGLELIGTRTLAEITERLLDTAIDARQAPLDMAAAALIDSFTLIKAPAADAVWRIADLLRPHKIDLGAALESFSRRLDLLHIVGVDTAEAQFSSVFGRSIEYYTGFVFQIVAPPLGDTSPIASGGRYDGLLADIGAPCAVPAVGSCIHTERLLAALGGELA
jgi:ATP phosphoribosyltransferase regulatory subunit